MFASVYKQLFPQHAVRRVLSVGLGRPCQPGEHPQGVDGQEGRAQG